MAANESQAKFEEAQAKLGEKLAPIRDIGGNFYASAGADPFNGGPEVIPEPEPEPIDPYTWYESDVPTIIQMSQYLANVSAIRSAFTLPDYAPQTPQSAKGMGFEKANDIESIFEYVEGVITIARKTPVACGLATCGGDYL